MKVISYNNSGKTFYSICNHQYIPVHHLITYYLQVQLANKATNTIERKAYELLFALKYFNKRKIDLISDVESLKFFSEEEISIFAKSCKLKLSTLDSEAVIPIISEVALRNLMARNQPTKNIVDEGTAKGRFDTFVHFYKFVFNRCHGHAQLPHDKQVNYNKCLIELVTSRKSLGSWKKSFSDPFQSNFPDEKYFELLDITQAKSNKNPFHSKIRNELIIKIFIETGLRRGAVAKLKISDVFNDRQPRIRVTRTPDDITDKRRYKASQKTKAHVSPISAELASKIEYYIKEVRANIPNTQTHEFVFVTEKNSRNTLGQPLSLRSYNQIFEKISNTLSVEVTPHILRHKWNEIFDVDIDSLSKELNLDYQTKEDVRKYAMGWSANSKMADIYNNFRLALKTKEYHLNRQKDLSSKISKIASLNISN
ncbi:MULTISPECIES: site-specific integrase [unclassified Pseudoalteromonas]|uniref:site-specific integrase n=1 Tax=unclassified Pseudoalteromonas TaxID=194690 RepID=UPI00332DE9B8